MAVIWFSDEDRERMRREKAENAEIVAEYDRICMRHTRVVGRDSSSTDVPFSPTIERLDIEPWPERPRED